MRELSAQAAAETVPYCILCHMCRRRAHLHWHCILNSDEPVAVGLPHVRMQFKLMTTNVNRSIVSIHPFALQQVVGAPQRGNVQQPLETAGAKQSPSDEPSVIVVGASKQQQAELAELLRANSATMSAAQVCAL